MPKYRAEFGFLGGLSGTYQGNTIDELYEAIENDWALIDFIKEVLMFGYFGEFVVPEFMKTQNYVIDNCMHFMWTVDEGVSVDA